ncbi:probable carotenoid cleavage dioxygenase 4, chloroplastic [Salvia hispanica]|uniref:probable carotenoid cleavage dioxygenase 4, chloroplastic n=1 Tax=Salvia hispanica TaxID=49212 RepID=UPI002008EFAB|nr:probable carotenoid cleavage dioxygenase 4, chloroplastic [Salvia hispanica]
MIHTVKISSGEATFCSRFVKTNKYIAERDLGYPIYPNMFGAFTSKITASLLLTAARILTGQFNPFANGVGTANTSLALIAGELFALVETDIPYQITVTENGDVATVGRRDFDSPESFQIMTAHPKFDPETGETFSFRYFPIPPFLKLFRIDSDGKKHKSVPIYSMKNCSFVHDFAVTKRFAVFPDTQIAIKPIEILRGKSTMRVDLEKIPKLGVIPRYAADESEMHWIDAPGLNLLHTANSWEEEDGGGEIVIIASNMLSIEHVVEQIELVDLSMEKIVIDLATKDVKRYPLSDLHLDFGVINPKYAGKKNRYVYAAVVESIPKMLGVVKIDLSRSTAEGGDCVVARRMYGPGCYGSEPIFVAREGAEEEDDGYLVAYVSNEKTEESHFVVMDAKSATLDIVAAVKLPRRVPQGFHSIFVKQTELLKM